MAPRSKAFNRGASVNIHSTGISCSSRLITRSTAQQQQPPTQLKAQTQQQLQEQQQQEQEEQDPDPDPESESGLGTESLLSTSSLPSQQQQFSYPKRSHTPSNSPHHRWSTSSLSSDIGRKSLHPTFTLNANLIPQLLEVISVIDIGVLPTDSLSETQNRVGLVHSAVKTLVFALLTCKSPSRHCQTFMAVISLLSRAREVTGIRAALFEDLHNAKTLLELIIAKTAFGIDDFMMEEIGAWELFHNASTFAENLHEESEEAKMMLQPIVYQYSTHRTVLLGSVEEEGFPRATRIFTSTTTSNPSVYSERKAEDGSFLSSEVSDVSVLEELEVRPYSRCTLETPATSHLGMQPSFSNACNMIQRLPLAAARLKPPNTATRKQIS